MDWINELEKKLGKVNLEDRFSEDLGMDSLDQVELLMNIENEYNIIISDEQAQQIKSVGDLLKTLSK